MCVCARAQRSMHKPDKQPQHAGLSHVVAVISTSWFMIIPTKQIINKSTVHDHKQTEEHAQSSEMHELSSLLEMFYVTNLMRIRRLAK